MVSPVPVCLVLNHPDCNNNTRLTTASRPLKPAGRGSGVVIEGCAALRLKTVTSRLFTAGLLRVLANWQRPSPTRFDEYLCLYSSSTDRLVD